jgi:MoCo/4Fe-4S cofactor protein with predicted Tat translocation signal
MKDRFTQSEISAIRAKLASRGGQALWRSLDELADTPDFRNAVYREFPKAASEWDDGPSRRNFLKLMAASLALAGLTSGCTDKTQEDIVPYVNQPESMVPGKPLVYATAMPFDGFGKGVLVSTREGRPIKVEGNPDHPASLGGSDVFLQASILTLYDPDRSQMVTRSGNASSLNAFLEELNPRLTDKRKTAGQGLRILSEPITSPTLAAQRREFLQRFPQARWHQYSPTARINTAAGAQLVFGKRVETIYRFDQANVVLSLDSDFLFENPASLRYARQFMDGRRVRRANMQMNRLYVVESTMTITGSTADHRIGIAPSQIATVADAIAARIANQKPRDVHVDQKWLDAVTADLRANAGSCIVIAGESQPPAVHAIAHRINQALGNIGKTVYYIDPVESDPVNPIESLQELVADMDANRADLLLILGGNPAYNAPADIHFAESLEKFSAQRSNGEYVNLTARLGLYEDETSFRSQWHLPEAHYLEAWGDIRAFDGTTSIVQPLILPLYNGRSTSEFLELLLGRPDRGGYEIVREFWHAQHNSPPDFEQWWQTALKQGVIANTASQPIQAIARAFPSQPSAAAAGPLELVIRTDPGIHDGSFATNTWLQELPKPFTKLVWDNAALVGPKTAETHDLHDEQLIAITSHGRSIEAPVLIMPGIPENTITVHLGYGRSRAAQMTGIGFDAYRLRTSDSPWTSADVQISATGKNHHLVVTRSHQVMDGSSATLAPHGIVTEKTTEEDRDLTNRRLVRVVSLEQYKKNPQIIKELGGEIEKEPLLSLYKEWDYSQGYQWAMSIDMTSCIGCNACVVACQAENNIPVVGKEEVNRQREMHWIRIDDYFGGDLDNPQVHHQPVPCMHCENAPCEYVCPVGATTHSAEGINQMTYNRCVGTRYCSNNCPYKVRRFNFFAYADEETTPQKKLQRNPDVTVRTKGVMEKCSYCIQRIQGTRIEIEKMILDLKEQARLATTETQKQQFLALASQQELLMLEQLQTACQQSCPTRAIEFGNINHPKTHITQLKAEPTNYGLLVELTTKPRTTYMARITNPNPALENGGDA